MSNSLALPSLEDLYPEKVFATQLQEFRKLGIAVIGFGKMGLLHSTILNLLVGGIVKAIVDKSLVVRIGFSRLFGKKIFYKNLHSIRDVDAVYITTPPQSHAPLLRAVLGDMDVRAVFLEKPATVNSNELEQVAPLARDRVVMVGLQKRYALSFRHAKILLEQDTIGDVERVYSYIKSGDILEKTNRFRRLGRGVLLDLGVHLIDLLLWLLGDLEYREGNCRSLYTGVDDYCRLVLYTHNSSPVVVETTWSDPGFRVPETLIEIYGSKGYIRVTEDYLVVKQGGMEEAYYRPHYYQGIPPVVVADPEFTIENMHFLLSLLEARKPETSLEDSKKTLRLIDMAYREAKWDGKGNTAGR